MRVWQGWCLWLRECDMIDVAMSVWHGWCMWLWGCDKVHVAMWCAFCDVAIRVGGAQWYWNTLEGSPWHVSLGRKKQIPMLNAPAYYPQNRFMRPKTLQLRSLWTLSLSRLNKMIYMKMGDSYFMFFKTGIRAKIWCFSMYLYDFYVYLHSPYVSVICILYLYDIKS
jgi:hypothetical protein